jgi:hypothetical protein
MVSTLSTEDGTSGRHIVPGAAISSDNLDPSSSPSRSGSPTMISTSVSTSNPSPPTSASSRTTAYPQPSALTAKPADHTEDTDHPTQHTKTQHSTPPRLLSTHLLANPHDPVSKAIKTIFPRDNPISRLARRFKVKHSVIDGLTSKEMARWEAEGPALRKRAGWKFEGEAGDEVVVGQLFWKVSLDKNALMRRCTCLCCQRCSEIHSLDWSHLICSAPHQQCHYPSSPSSQISCNITEM